MRSIQNISIKSFQILSHSLLKIHVYAVFLEWKSRDVASEAQVWETSACVSEALGWRLAFVHMLLWDVTHLSEFSALQFFV